MIWVIFLNVGLLILGIRRFMRLPVSAYNFAALSYLVIFQGGVSFIWLMSQAVGYKMPLMLLPKIEAISLVGLALFSASNKLGQIIFNFKIQKNVITVASAYPAKVHYALYMLALISVFAVITFVAVNGVGLGSGAYSIRYTDSQGLGALTVFLPAFLPYFVVRLSSSTSKRHFVWISMVGIGYGLLIYVALDGYRQIAIAACCASLIVGLMRGYVSKSLVLLSVLVFFPAAMIGLAFLRYVGQPDATFMDAEMAALYYIQGDLFPVDAPMKIMDYSQILGHPGVSIFFNHFNKMIPRILWPDKPDLILNAAGYYTTMVVGYGNGVTLSPTIMGEGLLVGGVYGFFIIIAISGLVCACYDALTRRANGTMAGAMLIGFLYFGFFMIREGLESAIYRCIVILVYYIIALCFYWCLAPFVHGNRVLYKTD